MRASLMNKSIQEDQEDFPEDEADSQSVSEDDDQAVSARPWTRSQGPPPALVGTTSLSKCSFNSQHSLLPYQVVLTREHSEGWRAGDQPCGGMSNSLCK